MSRTQTLRKINTFLSGLQKSESSEGTELAITLAAFQDLGEKLDKQGEVLLQIAEHLNKMNELEELKIISEAKKVL